MTDTTAPTNNIDWGPGENHIALRWQNKTFYVPELFHRSPTYIYRDFEGDSGRNFILITIDDCSNERNSSIGVKIIENDYLAAGLKFDQNYGRIIRVEGRIMNYRQREIHADRVEVIGRKRDFHVEVQSWREKIEYRKKLEEPWIFEPNNVVTNQNVHFTFEPAELKRREARRELILSSQEEQPVSVIEDSINLARNSGAIEHSDDTGDETDDEPIVVQVNDKTVKIITEFQLTFAIIKWIISKEFKPFKLAQLFHDRNISELLTDLTSLQLASIHLPVKTHPLSFEESRTVVFQRIRHNLQKNYKLISTSKSQNVRSSNLHYLYEHIKKCLNRLKSAKDQVFDVQYYLSVIKQKGLVGEELGYKLVNGIIDYIITDDFRDRTNWKYDPRLIQWSCIG
ncbi:uncharacterized protein J8A68_001343 [[Candida] subhashii]|uniref:CST complex subunit Stn1 N-terminal domain-containing protein n=1 Tax=[Candida] subhashii TaxID=561895 RepID=A0A8J5QUX6_9ASCO|nr:uncharacterized protein J8A68_001343 [[Candida] subhashii]KAG7665287.1 hypothetical protein J8A68_001343 [[Candida] subhashii]